MIEARGIGKHYGGLAVLSEVSLAARAGRVLGLIGPNGAGKSTLFNVLTGLVRPDAGQVVYDGRDITRMSPEARNRLGIARTFQIVKPFLRLSVLDNAMVGGFSGTARAREARARAVHALELVGLAARQHDAAHSLTLGDLKRLELARCLATQPRLLLLDEVMGGLNPTEMDQMVRLVSDLRMRGLTLVVVEHIMDAITALADDLVVLSGGRVLAQGVPAEVLRDPRVVEAYLGEPIDATA
jgi:ABC-type branched-subunit amino acid transport system ATPase component